ncbi:MAG: IS1380 family transposase [Actinobacteria bacterium]|nr:IS1380 family transposase [Actinomycetota bacterium]
MVHDRLDAVKVEFDDERAVANAGVLLVATLAKRLGLEVLVGECVRLGKCGARFWPGRKVLSLVFAMLLGAQSIDGCDVLRSGRTGRLLGVRVMAPSTLGTFLRAFSFGHVRQLDRVLGLALGRAWRAGARPGADRLVIDVDSFVGEVYGRLKQGASRGYTHVLGYHPLLTTRADTGEVLHIRFRTGKANTQRGVIRFVDELLARVRAAGATGAILLRADSGFHNKALRARLAAKGVVYSIGARVTKRVAAAISEIAEEHWQTLADYPASGQAQIAETTLDGERLIVRRVRPLGKDAQGKLFETWQHHALISNRTDSLALVKAEHRAHAVVELAIRDVKDQALAHFPSGQFAANAAWTVIACLAHNLHRWTELLGLPDSTPRRARTHRRRLLALPGRLTRHARSVTLHLPARWPWQTDYTTALTRIRALPALT